MEQFPGRSSREFAGNRPPLSGEPAKPFLSFPIEGQGAGHEMLQSNFRRERPVNDGTLDEGRQESQLTTGPEALSE